ncbi:WD40/YVTN/BNR-like repeat-containing protein [Planctomicrobium piriforme]|uniref:Photosynthesis system II assembly factor Ycf48/Hcf136-like domain-containing protein n=1 Tax=Planctomicrobium piriforme TaxID=1576369 RepID=A0A1I3D5S2_9PLAN|nr:hypothetical protein [Planctomicrobium piriforme]SFH82036.1 hypothetical protein SAMN05421753_103102 [Planctomicrobium piriforme]
MQQSSALSGPLFIAVGENNLRAFSKDGITWINQATGWDWVQLWQICFAAGRCATVGKFWNDQMCMTTRDGVNWDRHKFEMKPSGTRLESIGAVGGKFIGVRHMDGGMPHMITSNDGVKWTDPVPMLTEQHAIRHDAFVRRFAHGNGLTVAIGDYGMRLVSHDLKSWKAAPHPVPKDTLIDLAFGNGAFVGGGLHGLRLRSTDGLNWTHRTVGEEGEHINSMLFDGRRFVGVGQGATFFSPDGIQWDRVPNHNAPTTAACGGGAYTGSIWPGKILHSADAITWNPVHTMPHNVLAINYGVLGDGVG